VLYRGDLPRGDAVGTSERWGRRIVLVLVDRGVMTSESAYAPQRLIFPATLFTTLDAGDVPGQGRL
jgi:hypothetical protein